MEKAKLSAEEKELKHLKAIYNKAAEDVTKKIAIHDGTIKILLKDYDNLDDVQKSILQSKIYQKQFQESLQKQLDGFLADLNSGQYKSIDEYLNTCYETGFLGSMYDIHGQGIPIITPIDQKKVVKAKDIDSKISKKLYTKMGEDVDLLKKRIANNISRGIATSDSFANMARNIAEASNMGFNRAMRIARTEGHRIQVTAAFDAQKKAKDAGADIVKQWDAALDGRTRPTHRKLDGQIRELDEPFEVNGHKAMHPAAFGRPEEDINCRCALLQRAKWALDDDELETLKQRAEYFGLDKTKEFEEFKEKYLKAAEAVVISAAAVKIAKTAFTPAKTIEEAEEYAQQFVKKKTWSGDGNVSYKGLSLENANKFNETLTAIYEQNNIPALRNIQPMNFREKIWKGSETTPAAYRFLSEGDLFFNPKLLKNEKALSAYFEEGKEAYEICKKNLHKFTGKNKEMVETYLKAGRSLVADNAEDRMKAIIQHEIGHHIQNQIMLKDKEIVDVVKEGFEKYAVGISGYATKSYGEYIAESFCAMMNGEADRIDPILKAYFEGLVK